MSDLLEAAKAALVAEAQRKADAMGVPMTFVFLHAAANDLSALVARARDEAERDLFAPPPPPAVPVEPEIVPLAPAEPEAAPAPEAPAA